MNTLEKVKDFHWAFDQPVSPIPDLGDDVLNKLRVRLLREELDELEKALEAGDEVEVLDALTDLQYVLDGAYLSLGFHAFKASAFAEVHRSNMTKMWTAEEANEGWPDNHPDLRFELADVDENGVATLYVAYRKQDGKIIKPKSYSPANLKPILYPNER